MPIPLLRSSKSKTRDGKNEQIRFTKRPNIRSAIRSEPTNCSGNSEDTCGWKKHSLFTMEMTRMFWALSNMREGHSIKR